MGNFIDPAQGSNTTPLAAAVENYLAGNEPQTVAKTYGRQVIQRAVRDHIAHASMDDLESLASKGQNVKALNPDAAPLVDALCSEFLRLHLDDLRLWSS